MKKRGKGKERFYRKKSGVGCMVKGNGRDFMSKKRKKSLKKSL